MVLDSNFTAVHKPYVNKVTLREQNLPLKCCHPLDFWNASLKGEKSFDAANIDSVDQRAAKLLSIKV